MAAINADADGFWSAMPNGNRVNNARQGRALIQSLFPGGSTTAPLSAIRSGVISTASDGTQAYDLRVTVQSGRILLVQPGSAIIGRSGQGAYLGWELPAARTVTCDSPPASNPRNDIVVFRAYDTAQGDTIPASGSIPARIEIITGTPGAVPVDPVTWDATGLITTWPAANPGGGVGIPLARAQVSTGGVVTLTDLRRGTAPIGGVRVLLPGDLLTDPSYMPGDIRWFNGLDYWDGTNWNELGRPTIGLAARANATQTIAAGGLTFLNVTSAYKPATGITWNGSNQATVVTAGIYSMYCGVSNGFLAGANYSCCIVGATAPGAGIAYVAAPTFSTTTTDSSVSTTRWLAAGTVIRPAIYNNASAFTLNPTTQKPAEFEMWRV
ncbi:hypothetical protein AB0383_48725 [Amycolatopsis sp. NPDC051373]|uniref:hypothetical protein n=1 Tax=Amycolatopsis sp. NPDC051373 TaxID=3155801 RepID=UPI00344C1F2F